MPNDLRDLWIDEVSLVDDGANHEAHVVLWKSRDRLTSHQPEGVSMSPSASKTEAHMPELDISKLPPDAQEFISGMAKSHEAMEKALSEAKAELAKRQPAKGTDDIVKSAPPEVRALLAKTNKRLAEAEKMAREERDHRLTQEAITKARTEYKALAVDHAELGTVLKRLHDTDADLAAKVETVLKAATAQAEAGDIFKAVGSTGAKVTGAEERLEALAKAKAEGSDLTYEQAFAEALDENPELYAQYMEEAV